ncbi:hypothetical protein FCV25MIE_16268 [Fagus crenata]
MPSPPQPPTSRSEGSAPPSLLAHHLLHRVEEGEPRQRGLHLHDPRLQIQDRVRSFQHLQWNPQAPRHQTHPLVLHRRLQGLLPQEQGRLPPLLSRVQDRHPH